MAFCQWANEFDYYPQNSDDIVEDKVFTTANLAITDTKIKISLKHWNSTERPSSKSFSDIDNAIEWLEPTFRSSEQKKR